ncbi:hypothetical protein V6U89_15325 [Micromonospora sp. CPCC 206171]|uniref:Imm32 family immunity protein n=1 Tax=Micromonospora sp. CPCC 206171 TaxID=3122405 RepID=UPI002FF10B5D
MKILFYPAFRELDLSGSSADYHRLADVIAAGAGTRATAGGGSGDGEVALAAVEVAAVPGRAVLIEVAAGRLRVSGDPAKLAVLAENVRAMADAEDGGHLHVEYHPGHWYLAEGSVPLVVNSPHGAMPTR